MAQLITVHPVGLADANGEFPSEVISVASIHSILPIFIPAAITPAPAPVVPEPAPVETVDGKPIEPSPFSKAHTVEKTAPVIKPGVSHIMFHVDNSGTKRLGLIVSDTIDELMTAANA